MIRLCFILRDLDVGGAQCQVATLAKELDKNKFQIHVLTFYEGGIYSDEIKRLPHVNCVCLKKGGRWEVFSFLFRLIKTLKKIKPNLIHGYLSTPNCLSILLKPLFPETRMIWGIRSSYMDLDRYDRLQRLEYKIECFLSKFADLIIANSNSGFSYAALNGFPEKKMIVISNGIDTEKFRPDCEERARVRKEWKVKDDEVLIGLVGRLDPMKDHQTFLKSASVINSKIKGMRFVCVGDGPDVFKRDLVGVGEKLGLGDRLIWAGVRKDMPAVYSALDLLASSSFGEAFPNVIGEAMACSVPCVVTDVGDSSRIVGDTGTVVPPKDAEALAESLMKEISELDKKQKDGIRKQVRERIVENFSVSSLVENTVFAVNGLMGQTR